MDLKSGQEWTNEDIELLEAMIDSDCTIKYMSLRLGRSRRAIRYKIHKLLNSDDGSSISLIECDDDDSEHSGATSEETSDSPSSAEEATEAPEPAAKPDIIQRFCWYRHSMFMGGFVFGTLFGAGSVIYLALLAKSIEEL